MQIVEICEPNSNINNKREIAVGIDFGTTNSLVAISVNKTPIVIASNDGYDLVPSSVNYSNITISSIKRLFGKNFQDIINSPSLLRITKNLLINREGSPRLNINGKSLSAVEIASTIFLELKNMAEQYLKTEIIKAVITLPAYYNEAARGDVILAAKIAGFDVLRVLAEPTAAAYAYGLNKNAEGIFLVYDLGGGTFDISVLHMSRGILQVISTAGDNMLGGDDIDLLVSNYLINKYNIQETDLIPIAKQAKETLSTQSVFSQYIDSLDITVELDKPSLESIIYPIIQTTINLLNDVLFDLDKKEIKGIILVGGSSRIPLITKLLKENFDLKILSDLDPEKVVALGAALQAENLTYGSGMLLIDAVPLSLGLELYGGLVEKIILRNSPLPFIVKKEYTTYADNQTAIEFHIVQGEREFAKDCRSLGIFELAGLPPSKAGSIKIEVTFAIDLDGVLSVSAIEKTTKQVQMVIVNQSYGLSTEEVNNILENSYKNVNIDHENKILKESIINAENLINNINTIIRNDDLNKLINNQEEINHIIDNLRKSINASNSNDININIEKLQNLTEPFILNIVNTSVNKSLKGKYINTI